MKKEKLKHLVLMVVAVCLIGIGYLNYDYDTSMEVALVDNKPEDSSLRRCRIGKCQCHN